MLKQINIETSQLEQLQKYVMGLRHYLTPQNKSQQKINNALGQMLFFFSLLNKRVHNILNAFINQIANQEHEKINKIKLNKLLMYYFQLLNLVLINLKQSQHSIINLDIQNIVDIVHSFILIEKNMYEKTFKAFLIFYFNLIKKINIKFIQNQDSSFIFDLLSDILHCYFSSHQQQKVQKELKFKQQTEWMAMIIETLPLIQWQKINQNYSPSFIKNYFNQINQNPNQNIRKKQQFNILHMLGNFLHLVIQNRTTTQLVIGYECPIKDVKQMYSNSAANKLCNLKLNQSDILFICQLLIKYYEEQKSIFRKMFLNKQQSLEKGKLLPDELVSTRTQSENEDFHKLIKNISSIHQQHVTVGQLILESINILNSLLFLGGYSPKLQQLVYHKLFENNTLPEFLQLAYLIYNQRRFMGKYSIKLNMVKPPDVNLSKLLEIDYQTVLLQQRKAIFKLIALEIRFGQLSILLRLMTNLIHINNQALAYFQQNIKYLHMVMSLTHQSEINLTMKNWAVLFIKNSCDSPKLREQINQVKIQMKVDE